MLLRITRYGEPVLRQIADPVEAFDSGLRQLAKDMHETMLEAEGIGLAAPQVNLPLRLFIVDLQVREREIDFTWDLDGKQPPLDLIFPLVAVNPVVTKDATPGSPYTEGCLSIPGISGDVVRPEGVRMEYQDVDGNPHVLTANGLLARCIQHEADHLDGVLIIDHFSPQDRKGAESKLKRLKRESRDFLRR